jgi:23S rRNA pseudouridine1911/1915/1917 synthase
MAAYRYDSYEKCRLDIYLADKFPQHSRSRIQKWIAAGAVTVNGRSVTKAGLMLEMNDEIQLEVPEPEPTTILPEPIQLEVIYEDANLLVINKPAGIVVHPGAGHLTGTIVNAALAHAPEMEGIGGEGRPGIVHRLDKDTSGLLLLAKNDPTHRYLQDQFRDRLIHKTYLALVDGAPPSPEGIIQAAIARDPSHRKRMAVVPEGRGREAVSRYRILKSFPHHTYVEVNPQTGRTHQIRLHLSFIGCPVVGDTVYGLRHPTIQLGRHFLHAARLMVTLPGEKSSREFSAPLAPELQKVLQGLESEEE